MKSNYKNLLLPVLLAVLVLPVFSQSIDLKKVDKYIENARKDWQVPGMAVAVVKDGEIILEKGYGRLGWNNRNIVDENTLFAIASNTKAFVSSALAVLVDRGEIQWDDKVRKYLPRFAMYDEYVSEHITIRDLLCHRAGLGTFSGDVIWYKSERSAAETIEKIKYIPQQYEFRAGYGYSNVMFITAGEVIRAITGKAWDTFVKETFFNPLGMERTVTSVEDIKVKGNFASPHKGIGTQEKAIEWVNWDNMGAAGGIISSVHDMAQWLKLQLNKGIVNGDTLLAPEQQNILWTPHNNYVLSEASKQSLPGRHFNGYGLGWGLYDYYGNMVVTHSGGYDGMYSRVMLVPDQQLGIVVLTNSMSGITSPLCYYIVNSFIQKDTRDWSAEALKRAKANNHHQEEIAKRRAAKQESTSTSVPLSKYTGVYHDPMYGNLSVELDDEQLYILFEDAPLLSAQLKHWHYDTFEIIWEDTHAWFDFGTMQFVLNNNLEVEEIKFDVPNYDIFFEELHFKKN